MKNGLLKDVYFYYTCIKKPTNKFESQDKEFKTTVCVNQSSATKFLKEFPKMAYKLIPNDEFFDKYKSEAPFPEQAAQYMMTFKRDEVRKDGTPVPEEHLPKAYLEDGSGEVYNITKKLDVGNGSKGDIHYFVIENPKYGDFPKLSQIKVTNLIKYEASGSVNLADKAKELPDDLSDIDTIQESPDQPAPRAAPTQSTASSSKPPVVDDELPF